jgi:general secretion pathway protein N
MGREPVQPEPAIGGNPLWSVPLTALSATRERPIFSPSRRPPPPQIVAAPYAPPPKPPPPAPPPEPDHPLLTLLGTLAGETGGIGIFIDQNDNAPVSLRIGEAHQGWVLRAVRGREAVFERNDRTATLALPLPAPERPVAAPANRTPIPEPKPNSDFWNR